MCWGAHLLDDQLKRGSGFPKIVARIVLYVYPLTLSPRSNYPELTIRVGLTIKPIGYIILF